MKFENGLLVAEPLASLSSRRAWIEISGNDLSAAKIVGRSPHGERGLKFDPPCRRRFVGGSLSSRRAWIEIGMMTERPSNRRKVVLLTESVD